MAGMRYQPQGLARLGAGISLARGLRMVLLPSAGYQNLANRRSLEPKPRESILPAPVVTRAGVGWSQVGSNMGWTAATTAQEDLSGIDEATILTFFIVTESVGAGDANRHTIFCNGGVNSSTGLTAYPHVGSNISIAGYTSQRGLSAQWRQQGYNTLSLPEVRDLLTQGMLACAVSTYQRGGICELWLDGRVISSATASNLPLGLETVGGGIQVGRSDALGPVALLLACTWDRKLAPAEIMAISANPWQIFAAVDDDDFAAAPIARTLSVGRASLALEAGEVGMRVSRRVRVQPSALAIAGGQALVRASRRVSLQPTAMAIGAGPARMLVARRLDVQPAALAVAGQGVAMRAARRMQIAPAPLALAAGPVVLQYSPALAPGAYTLPVSAAAMRLTGGAVGMRVTRRMAVVGAPLQLAAGAVRALVGRRLVVTLAPLVIEAGPVSVRAARRVRLSAAQLVLAGGNVQLRYSAQVAYARAPAGAGYAPHRAAITVRPEQTGGHRPPATQETTR